MFVLKDVPDLWVDVEIQVPGEEAVSTFQARWRLHSWSEYQRIVKAMQTEEVADETLVDDDLLEIAGIQDEHGNDVAHSAELVSQLLEVPYVRRPLILSWFKAQEGRAAAAAKN